MQSPHVGLWKYQPVSTGLRPWLIAIAPRAQETDCQKICAHPPRRGRWPDRLPSKRQSGQRPPRGDWRSRQRHPGAPGSRPQSLPGPLGRAAKNLSLKGCARRSPGIAHPICVLSLTAKREEKVESRPACRQAGRRRSTFTFRRHQYHNAVEHEPPQVGPQGPAHPKR